MPMSAKFSDLAGASVFITGGASGIGASLTAGYLAQGANVAFVQRSDATGFCDRMEQEFGKRPMFLPCDVTDIPALREALELAAQAHGPITVLVNNAANDQRHLTKDVTEEYWDWAQATNLKYYFFTCQAVIEGMRKAGGGAIINYSSISYMLGLSGFPAYTTANAGINGMTRSLAREFGADNIRVNALAPGWILTQKQLDMWATPESLVSHLGLQCLKQHMEPDDLIGPTLFLSSDASAMITGQTLVVDAGVVVTG